MYKSRSRDVGTIIFRICNFVWEKMQLLILNKAILKLKPLVSAEALKLVQTNLEKLEVTRSIFISVVSSCNFYFS